MTTPLRLYHAPATFTPAGAVSSREGAAAAVREYDRTRKTRKKTHNKEDACSYSHDTQKNGS